MVVPALSLQMMAVCPVCGRETPDEARFCVECGAAVPSLERDTLSDDPFVGRVLLDRYRIVRLLGSGALSRVYLAQQLIGPAVRNVAVKVLMRASLPEADADTAVKRFYRECETIVALSHPNIIRVYDFGQLDDGTLFIAMEYIEGAKTLAELLPLPLERVQAIVTQVSDALNEAHTHGIIHRDLKPDNVLLATRAGHGDIAKVLDFGIAKHVESSQGGPALTDSGVVLGTPPYMSPEQFGGGPLDGRSDVYSLGVMTYELLTGELPFYAESPWEWAARHLAAEPAPLESTPRGRDLPETARAAVMHALAKDPRDRPQTAPAFALELTGAVPQGTVMMSPAHSPSSFPPQNLPPTVLMEERPSMRARKRWTTLVGAFVALAAIVSLYALLASGIFRGVAGGKTAASPASVSPAPAPKPAAAASAPPTEEANDGYWFQSVHHVDNASNAQFVLGKPDGQYALIGGGGFITLEVAHNREFVGDGTSRPDLEVRAAPDNRASYSVEVSADHHHFVNVVGSSRRPVAVDLDDRAVKRARYVRIRNRSATTVLKIDAIEANTVRPFHG